MPGLLELIGQALSMPTALAQQKVNLQASQLANQKLQGLLAAAFPDQQGNNGQQQAPQQAQQQAQSPQPQQPNSTAALTPPLLSGAINSINAAQPGGGLLPQPQQHTGLLPQTGQTTQSPTGPVTTHGLLPIQAQPAQPSQQPQQQPQQPFWLTPPNAQMISQIPLPSGLTPHQAQALGVLSGKDPTEISNAVRAQQLSVAQQRYSPIIGKLETIRQTANPMQMILADPELAAAWPTIAKNAGINPNTTSAADVRTALTYERNQLAGGLSEATVAPQHPLQNVPGGIGGAPLAQIDSVTGEYKPVAQPETDKFITPEGVREMPKAQGIANHYQPFSPTIFGASSMSDGSKEFAYQWFLAHGSLPANYARSPAMQANMMDYIAQRAKQDGDTPVSITANNQATQATQSVLKDYTAYSTPS